MISFPPFRLDSDNKCLWKCTASGAMRKLTLPPRAFDMLEFLIRNAGRLVTHEGLLSALWPNQWVQPEVIKTHVRSIRSVLEDDARQPKFIETHRSRGYRFIADVVSSESDCHVAPAPIHKAVTLTSNASAPGRLALRDIVALLERIPDEQPAAWLFEDAHKAEHSAADGLSPCVRNVQAAHLTVIVRYLPDDVFMIDGPVRVLH